MIQFQENSQAEGWTEGQTDGQTLFDRTLLATSRGQKTFILTQVGHIATNRAI